MKRQSLANLARGPGGHCPNPAAGVILDSAGNLYGTTTYGGSLRDGVAFELSPAPGGGR